MTPTLSDLKALDAKATKGVWKWWTSNSWRRLRSDIDGGRKTVSVIEPYVSRRDHHPDCIVSEEDMDFIVACVAYVRAELAKTEGK